MTPRGLRRNRPNGAALSAWAFLLPALAVFTVFMVVPIILTLYYSFTDFDGIGAPAFIGLRNYSELLADTVFQKTIQNSVVITVAIVGVLTIAPLPMAALLAGRLYRLRLLRALYYLPVVTPIIITAVAWKWILSTDGVLNWALVSLGLVSKPIVWLSSADMALFSILIVIFWRAFGWYLVFYIAGLATISPELYEAAAVDGSGGFASFRYITIPLLRSTTLMVAVIAFINSLKIFDEIYIMTKGGPADASKSTAYFIYEAAFTNGRFGYSAAAAVVLLIVGLVGTAFMLRLFEGGGAEEGAA